MTPHSLAALSPAELKGEFRKQLKKSNITAIEDVFTQLESRFRRMSGSPRSSQQFLDEFLELANCAEVRAVRITDPILRIIERMEYLLEAAGDLARAVTEESFLRRVVESRERGPEIVKALLAGGESAPTLTELAARLETTPQNLSPVIRIFRAQGIVEASKDGRNVYLKLTTVARNLFTEKRAPAQVVAMFGTGTNVGRGTMAARRA